MNHMQIGILHTIMVSNIDNQYIIDFILSFFIEL